MVVRNLPKVKVWVRFPLPAYYRKRVILSVDRVTSRLFQFEPICRRSSVGRATVS